MNRLILLALLIVSVPAAAQVDTVRLKQNSLTSRIVTDRPPQAVYFQLGGSGPFLSVNYDRRFGKRVNGLGFTTGIGFWGETGASLFSVPLSLNYLAGRKTHFLELAAGTTFLKASTWGDYFSVEGGGTGFIYHASIGYRHQPTTGGFFFRGGVSPLFGQGEYATWFYLGFGYNF
jgi:hypothetical protein